MDPTQTGSVWVLFKNQGGSKDNYAQSRKFRVFIIKLFFITPHKIIKHDGHFKYVAEETILVLLV